MAGLDPAIHVFAANRRSKTWMARLNRAMTILREWLSKPPLRDRLKSPESRWPTDQLRHCEEPRKRRRSNPGAANSVPAALDCRHFGKHIGIQELFKQSRNRAMTMEGRGFFRQPLTPCGGLTQRTDLHRPSQPVETSPLSARSSRRA